MSFIFSALNGGVPSTFNLHKLCPPHPELFEDALHTRYIFFDGLPSTSAKFSPISVLATTSHFNPVTILLDSSRPHFSVHFFSGLVLPLVDHSDCAGGRCELLRAQAIPLVYRTNTSNFQYIHRILVLLGSLHGGEQ